MWNEALGWLKFVASLISNAKRERAERERMRRRVDELTDAIQYLLERDLQRTHEEELRRKDEEQRWADAAHERENLLLRLKIQLLEYERRLPPPSPSAPPLPSLDKD